MDSYETSDIQFAKMYDWQIYKLCNPGQWKLYLGLIIFRNSF